MALRSHIENLSTIFFCGDDYSIMKAKNPEYIVKRDFRLLRAKVIKILEDHFTPNPDAQLPRKPLYRIKKNLSPEKPFEVVKTNQEVKKPRDSFKTIKQIEENFLKTRYDEEYGLKHQKTPKIMPKYMDRGFQSTKIRFPKENNSPREEVKFDKPIPTIDLLCKHLHPIEIEHVCRDPIYFLGIEAYQRDPNLLNLRGWTAKSNNGTLEIESEEEVEDEFANQWKKSGSSYFKKNYGYYDLLSKTTLRNIRKPDKETPVLKNQQLIKQKVQTVKKKIEDEMKRFAVNRAHELTAEREKVDTIQNKLSSKLKKAELVHKNLEIAVKERVQTAHHMQDYMHQRLRSTRQQQTEEAELKETNFLIRKNLISKIAEQKVEEAKRARKERAAMSRTFGHRNFFSRASVEEDKAL